MKITTPGVYANVPMSVYHGPDLCVGPSVSSSGLRTIVLESPEHYWDGSPYNPDRAEEEDSQAFILGRATHHLLLGQEAFSTEFTVRPAELAGKPWQGNRTECKAWLDAQAKAGRTVLKGEQIEQIRGMAKALGKHPLITAGILNGRIEQSMVYQDKATGIWIKCRPDAIPNDGDDYADLKITSSEGLDRDRDIWRWGYDLQAALVGMAHRELFKREMQSFTFVFVGAKRPHTVDVLTLDKDAIADAERDLRVGIDTFAWCMKHGNWFGPGGTQMDARFVSPKSEWNKRDREYRRDFLKREIDRAEATDNQYADVI